MTIPILYCLVSGSAITDILKNKIFNSWLLLGCLAKFAFCLTGSGMQELIFIPIAKALLTLMFLLPVYIVHGIGGGDLKLFAVLSMFLTTGETVSSIIIAFIIAAVIGVLKIFIQKDHNCTIHFAVPIMISVFLVTGGGGLICT
ncbi:prepilin peptidase [Butyrivibrio sp. INlla16]|uniref:prepilin peptidase n=1 Tax=Butyrivibrio sp. INlla16 TaxID=1520807 RepID=UPI00088A4263|nr:prepilin peptidase [Butyrivibrio sp. INlla16]SDB54798.1 Type IV leader peptidase family protein [Butyrivibrio sp. INlla16]